MIIKARRANGARHRKVYKIVRGFNYTSIWSIIVRWDKKSREWVEECSMVENEISRISHLMEFVDGQLIETKVEIIDDVDRRRT